MKPTYGAMEKRRRLPLQKVRRTYGSQKLDAATYNDIYVVHFEVNFPT